MTTNIQRDPKQYYFETSDGKHILPASFGKRFLARLIDFIIYLVIGRILLSIEMVNRSSAIRDMKVTEPFQSFVNVFNPLFIVGMISIIVLSITLGIIYPLFINKKNIGQTLGKKMLGITPMYLRENYTPKKDFLIREIPILWTLIVINIIVLATGIDYISYSVLYNNYVFKVNEINPGGANQLSALTTWKFIKESSNPEILGASSYQQAFGYIYVGMSSLFTLMLIVLLFSIGFGNKKRGLHDSMAKTAIVDLNTLGYFQSENVDLNEADLTSEMDDLGYEFIGSKLVITSFEFEKKEKFLEPNNLDDSNQEVKSTENENLSLSNLSNETIDELDSLNSKNESKSKANDLTKNTDTLN